jgi:hypothetical protein
LTYQATFIIPLNDRIRWKQKILYRRKKLLFTILFEEDIGYEKTNHTVFSGIDIDGR